MSLKITTICLASCFLLSENLFSQSDRGKSSWANEIVSFPDAVPVLLPTTDTSNQLTSEFRKYTILKFPDADNSILLPPGAKLIQVLVPLDDHDTFTFSANGSGNDEELVYARKLGIVGPSRNIRVDQDVVSPTDRFPSLKSSSSYFNLLQHPEIRNELEITDSQSTQIESLTRHVDETLASLLLRFNDLGGADSKSHEIEKLRRDALDAIQEYDESLKEILAPQWKFWNDILLSQYVREIGLFRAILDPGIAVALDVNAENQKKLKEILKTISADADRHLIELKERLISEFSEHLTDEQVKRLCKMAGVQTLGEIDSKNILVFFAQLKRISESDCCEPAYAPGVRSFEPVPDR